MKQNKNFILVFTFIAFILFISVYFGLLPITLYSNTFRFMLLFIILLSLFPFSVRSKLVYRNGTRPVHVAVIDKEKIHKIKYGYYLLGLLLFVFMILGISSWAMFNSSRYRNLMTVTESEGFSQNIEEISQTKVPIVDKDLAFRLGDKKLGESKGLGSQYTVNNYTMIEMKGELYWVGALEYTGFFKWLSNKDEGVPGYIMINATNTSDVQLVSYKMKYVPSAYFNQDLMRRIYFSGNMGKLFSNYTAFELDEEGHPYYVKTVLKKKFAFSNGVDTVGVVVLDAVNGDVKYYDKDQAPSWIDRIQPQDIIIKQLGYYGKYVHGFFNTIFAKKEVLQVSEGYSYIYNNGEFYLYTGLTSVGSDESIVGFTLTNMRTKETIFYRIGGATEYSAQKSAEGAVQDLGYQANWPILVNFKNYPTYFMTLKDQEGLIKKYAYVNVKDYSIFGIGNNLLEAQSNYLKNLRSSNTNPNTGTNLVTVESKVSQIVPLNIDGTTYYYIVLEDDLSKLFISSYSVSYELPLTKIGDSVTIKYYENENNIYTIEQFDNEDLNIVE